MRGKESPMDIESIETNDFCFEFKAPLQGTSKAKETIPTFTTPVFDSLDSDVSSLQISPPLTKRRRIRKRKRSGSSDIPSTSQPLTNSWNAYFKHSMLPYILTGYLQLFFNIFIVSLLICLVLYTVSSIKQDIDKKVYDSTNNLQHQIQECAEEYVRNRCHPPNRAPALQSICTKWEVCMSQDPEAVGVTKLTAEAFGEILNKFIDPLSFKTMIFCVLMLFGSLILSNFAFGLIGRKAIPAHVAHQAPMALAHSNSLVRQ